MTDRLYGTTNKQFRVVKCAECGLIRLHPQPGPSELAEYYPTDYWYAGSPTLASRLEEGYRRFVLQDHVRFVRRALVASGVRGPLVDIGCGGGLFLSQFRDTAVIGMDNSLQAVRVAWKNKSVPAVCCDVLRAPLRPESCGVITMFHVVEHLPDPVSFLQAAHGLLQPDGRLVVQVPNADSWQFRLLGKRWNGVDVPRHLFNYRRADLLALLRHCGFAPVREKHFSLRDNPAGLASSLAPGLDPMARQVRRVQESAPVRLLKHAMYFGLVLASLPFTVAEAMFRAGSSIMVEARKKA